MTSEAATESTCSVCSQSFLLDDLVSVGGYPACRTCLAKAPLDGRATRPRRYHKIVKGRQVAGVCGGIADGMNMERDTLRVIAAIGICMTGFLPGVVIYLVLAAVMPTAAE